MTKQEIKGIMLIDDDISEHQMFRMSLRRVNPNVELVTALDGDEALKMLSADASKLPDLIFLDLNMPKMNGMECLNRLKSNPALCSIPAVIQTNSNLTHEIKEAQRLGAAYFLTKPYMDDLIEVLAYLLNAQGRNVNMEKIERLLIQF